MFEVVIIHKSNSWKNQGTKETLFLNEDGYQRCRNDESVEIVAVGQF